jgi:hypothetical protein
MSAQQPPSVAETAIALVTAHLAQVPEAVFDGILADVDAAELAVFLAAVAAHMIRETDGGQEWLQRYGIAAAAGVVD